MFIRNEDEKQGNGSKMGNENGTGENAAANAVATKRAWMLLAASGNGRILYTMKI